MRIFEAHKYYYHNCQNHNNNTNNIDNMNNRNNTRIFEYQKNYVNISTH